MPLDCIAAYDATGGGVMTVVAPTSLTIKGDASQTAYIVAYCYDGISAEEVTITNGQNTKWPATGVSLKCTSDGTAVGASPRIRVLSYKLPVQGGDVLVLTSTSGANPVHLVLYIDYPPYSFGLRPETASEAAILWTRPTVAGGTNCAAGTSVQAATNMVNWGDRVWTPVWIESNAAFTTTAFIAIRKFGGASNLVFFPIGLTDVANDQHALTLPKGLGITFTKGDAMEYFWISATAEQPTANITFATSP